MKKIITLAIAATAVLSCTKPAENTQTQFEGGVVALAKDFQDVTKTTISATGSFSWAEGDVIGVVPADGKTFQTNYELKNVGTDPKTAAFDGGAWALKAGKEYVAYYPCQSIVLTSNGTAEVSFAGQKQAANGSTAHLGAYDYMYAQAVSPADGSCTFAFNHLVSLVKLTVPVQADGVYTSIALACESEVFAKNATLSLADGSLAAGDLLSNVTVALDNLSLNAGEELAVWAVVLPTEAVAGKKLSATLTSSEGEQTPYNITTEVAKFEAGKAYALAGAVNSNVIFSDDFSWMKNYFSAYETGSGKKVGDTIGSQSAGANSPQIYDSNFPNAFREEFVTRGWSDLNPSGRMVYINDAYLKLSKTGGNNTAVKLALEQYIQDAGEIVLELAFDYAMQIQGDGTVDAGPVIVLIDGDGTFENDTKVSSLFTTSQAKGELAWQKVTSVKISGASKNTKLIWVNGRVMKEDGTFNWSVSGAGRFFLDNIMITK